MTNTERLVYVEMDEFLNVLPPRVTLALKARQDPGELLEVVLDLGRAPEARFTTGDVTLDLAPVTREDLETVTQRVGDFGDDNRAGIERTLHRISAIRNRRGQVVGITCRVGRAVFGTIKIIDDLAFSGKNILLLGRPGVGKTTMLREMARVLSTDSVRSDTEDPGAEDSAGLEPGKRVIIVDTSNEIAGDGDVPHPAIGRARRMQVTTPARQHAVMIEAVENHMPQVIVIDEMGTEEEAAAARTIAERGVQLIATAHGNTLDNLILNPTLSDLVGGVQTVTLGDQEARYRRTQKTVLERKAPPTFEVVVEIQGWEKVAVHENVARVVDQWLRGFPIAPDLRWLDADGQVQRDQEAPRRSEGAPPPWSAEPPDARERPPRERPSRQPPRQPGSMGPSFEPATPEESEKQADLRVFLFGVGRDKLEAAVAEAGSLVAVVNELRRADAVLTTKTHYRRGSTLVRTAESAGTPVYVLRKNTMPQVYDFLRSVTKERNGGSGRASRAPEGDWSEGVWPDGEFSGGESSDVMQTAMREAEEAAQRVLGGESSIKLTPQKPYVRRLQHILGQRYNVSSISHGRDPARSVMFYKP